MALPKPAEKQSHKIPKEALQAILDLTLAGYKPEEIQKFILENFSVSVHSSTIFYHRRTKREKLTTGIDAEIEMVRAMYPETATLIGRIRTLEESVKREMRKRKSSGYVIAELVGKADAAMYRAAMLKQRLREFERKYPQRKDDQAEAVLQEIEKRSHIIRDVTNSVDEFAQLAGSDFLNDPASDDRVIRGDVVSDSDAIDESALVRG